MLGKHQVGVAHSAWQGHKTAFHRHRIQGRPVADIVVMALWQDGKHFLARVQRVRSEIPRAARNIFAVIITYIGKETALPQHILAAAEIGDPFTARLPPCVRAFKVQPELSEPHSGHAVIGLVHIAVKHDLVHSLAELTIPDRLQDGRVLGESIMMPE